MGPFVVIPGTLCTSRGPAVLGFGRLPPPPHTHDVMDRWRGSSLGIGTANEVVGQCIPENWAMGDPGVGGVASLP